MITFTKNVSAKDSMIFDSIYEPGLQLIEEDKSDILSNARIAYMLVDGELAGEAFGSRLSDLDEEIEDCGDEKDDPIYCYSTTILPQFQGHGYSYLLKAFWLGLCAGVPIVGHSTSDTIKRVNERFGAIHSVKHENWYGTPRTAWFYHLKNE